MRRMDIKGRRNVRNTIRKRNTDIRENKELVSEWIV